MQPIVNNFFCGSADCVYVYLYGDSSYWSASGGLYVPACFVIQ